MAFINWGSESDKQKRYRKFLEEQALLEQAINASQGRSGNAPGVGGGSLLYKNPQPGPDNQTTLMVFYEFGQANYRYYIANYETGNITGPFDTGVSVEDYSLNDLYTQTITYGGYLLRFYRGDINEHTMLFMDREGMIVESITAISTDVTSNDHEGYFISASDFDENLLWVFDGASLLTNTTILDGVDYFSIGSNQESAIPAGLGVFTSTAVNEADTLRKFYLCTGTSATQVYQHTQTAENNEYVDFYLYGRLNKVIVHTRDNSTGALKKLEVISVNGTVEQTITINTTIYTQSNFEWFGDKHFFLHLYNGSDLEVNHRIYNYDGSTGNVSFTDLDAQKYTNWSFKTRTRYSGNSYNYPTTNAAAFVFYSNELSNTNGFVEADDILIYCIFEGRSPIIDLFADGETRKIYLNDEGLTNNYVLFLTDDENNNEMWSRVIKPNIESSIYTSLGHSIVDLDDIDVTETGERVAVVVEYDAPIPINTIVHSFNSTGAKSPGVLELETTSHSTLTNYGTYIVDGDDTFHTFLTASGNWVQYPRLGDFGTASYYSNPAEGKTGPYVMTWGENTIPYTHTRLSDDPDEGVAPEQFIMDGTVDSGSNYFGAGSSYFTNLYPGLFTLVAKSINVNQFRIDGNIGADGGGQVATAIVPILGYSKSYTAYVKKVHDAGDPSINHIIIIDTDGTGVTQEADLSSEDDFHQITGIESATELHYLLFAKADGYLVTEEEIEAVITEYLDLVEGQNAATTLSTLNSNYSNVTGVFNAYDSGEPDRIYYFSDYSTNGGGQISDGGDDMYDTANMLYASIDGGTSTIVFNASGVVSEFSVPSFETVSLGKNGMYYLVDDLNTGDIIIRNYSLNGQLLGTANTGRSNWQQTYYVEDRGLAITEDKFFDAGEGVLHFYTRVDMITRNGITHIEVDLPDATNKRIIHNDWAWLND